jgi:transducin (beta)-like 1
MCWVLGEAQPAIRARSLTEHVDFRSKDAVINIWKLPKPPQRLDAFMTSALPPISLPNLSKAAQADLTALHWSPDGELLAIGSYDSIFRICTRKGFMYVTHDYHQVRIPNSLKG